MKDKPKLIIFASGSKTGGGSGFENLVNASHNGILNADIVAVVSNHENGGVREKADRLGIRFVHFVTDKEHPPTAEQYQKIVRESGAEFTALSGWLKLVTGLDPRTTFNIHPGPLPRFGGPGMYGHYVHEAVLDAYKKDPTIKAGVSMHFVTEKYDEGPLFFAMPVDILPTDDAETLAKRVNEAEHKWQPIVTNAVVNNLISWDGSNPQSLDNRFKPDII